MDLQPIIFVVVGLLLGTAAHAQTCNSAISASTPTSRFVINGDGTVTDSDTGLMWKQCSEGQTTDGAGGCSGSAATYTWQQALQQAQTLNTNGGYAGQSDWRVPNIKELDSIVERKCYSPAINETVFPGTPSLVFGSASPDADDSDYGWYVYFYYGYDGFGHKSLDRYVRLVRGGQSFAIGPPVTSITPVPVEVTNAAGLYVREGPGTGNPIFTEISDGQQFVAFQKSEQGSDVWYKIHLPCGNSSTCAGWVAGTYQSITYSIEEPTATQVEVTGTGSLGLNIRAYPNGSVIDSAWDGQRFVTLGTQPSGSGCYSNWYEIYLPLISAASTGWVWGEFVSVASTPALTQSIIAAGNAHTIALRSDSTLLTWGYNFYGQLGDGNFTTFQSNPVPRQSVDIAGNPITGISAVAANSYHNLAIKSDGSLLAWGDNRSGELGDGTTTRRSNPVPVVDVAGNPVIGIAAVATGDEYSLALKNDGTLLAWGANNWGQLGDGNTTSRPNPVPVVDAAGNPINGIIAITAGDAHTVALKSDGMLLAWGVNHLGQLGNGSVALNQSNPVPMPVVDTAGNPVTGIVAIAAGRNHTVALKNDGTILAWGDNYFGQLGDGSGFYTNQPNPVPVIDVAGNSITGITAITAGYNHTVALKRDGTLLTWGSNSYGELGDGTTTSRSYPVTVVDVAGNPVSGIAAITAGYDHTVALKGDGTLLAWGRNYYGQLGDGTTTDRWNPVVVGGATPISLIGSVSIQGRVLTAESSSLPGVTIALTGAASGATSTFSDGAYSFTNLSDGSYTLTPSLAGYTFAPPSRPNVNVSGANRADLDFRACQAGQSMTGTLTDQNNNPITGADAVLYVDGVLIPGAIDPSGKYTVTGLSCDQHTIRISATGSGNFAEVTGSLDSFNSWNMGNTQLTRKDSSYGVTPAACCDPVNTATGNYIYQRKDLELPGKGMPFAFNRSYNSQAASEPTATDGPLGYGWTHNYNVSLDAAGGSPEIHWDDGRVEVWAPDGVGGFTPQSGIFDALIDDGGGAYTLRRKNLTEYHFDTSGQLTSIVDKNGNTLALTYSGGNLSQVTDTAGRTINFTYDAGNHITQITDPIARSIQYAYDPNNNLVSANDLNGNVTRYTYDTSHQVLTITDPRGNALVNNTYDPANRVVIHQADAKGGTTQYAYEALDRKTTVTDALGNISIRYHDPMLRLVKEVDAKGGIALYEYDDWGNRVKVTDKNGNVTQYGYDASGNVTTKTDALLNVTTITYNASNNPLTRTDALGNTTGFTYDANGNLLTTTDALANATTVTYDAGGLPLTITDARGNTTTNTYDVQGNLTQVQDALGNITQYTYDDVGRRLTRVDALSRTTTYAYDNNNNPLSVTDPAGNTVAFSYDGNNNKLTTTDKNGNLTRFVYDEKDLLATTTDALGGVVTNTYDAIDRRTAVQDRNGNATRSRYDAVGNLIKVTDALTDNSQFTYDANGNRLSATDPNGNTSLSTYDALNRRARVRDALGNATTMAYDELGRTTSVTNARHQVTVFSYDKLGRRIQVMDADSGTVQNAYDENGNRISMTDPNGNVTTYAYDALNRLVTKAEPLGNTTRYQYDAVGNLSQVTRPNGDAIQYAYDNLDRLTTITYPDASMVSFSYDNNGNRIQMVDSLGTQTYVYDALNRRAAHTDPFGNTVGYGYDANGNRTSLTYPDGKTVTYGYDALNRQTTVTDWLTNTTSYSYDAAGRLTGTALPNGATAAYVYDNANRLTSLTNAKLDASVISSYSYTLDAIGNHKAEDRNEPLMPVLTPGTVAYTYDTENRLTDANGTANSFDNNGNLTAKGADGYVYDYENRLTQTTIGGVTAQYQYDGLGNRYARTRGGVTTRFVLDTNTSLTNVLAETDAGDNITAYNLYGLGLIARIQPDGTASYYHYDSRGSTIALTDNSGATTDTYAYDPFGKPANRTGSTANPFTYIGSHGVIDEGDDLFYIRARYYDSEQQRFVNKDPKVGSDQDGQNLNRYIYAVNNPVILIDVSGFSPKEGQYNFSVTGSSDGINQYLVDTTVAGSTPSTVIFSNSGVVNELVWNVAGSATKKLLINGLKRSSISIVNSSGFGLLGEGAFELYQGLKIAPVASSVASGFTKYRESRLSGANKLESLSRASFSVGISAAVDAALLPLKLTGPGGLAVESVISGGVATATDWAYDRAITPMGEVGGNILFNLGVFNPDKKVLGIF